jgi:hypothetical protein
VTQVAPTALDFLSQVVFYKQVVRLKHHFSQNYPRDLLKIILEQVHLDLIAYQFNDDKSSRFANEFFVYAQPGTNDTSV